MDIETDTSYKTIVDNYDEEHDNRISAFVSMLVEFINKTEQIEDLIENVQILDKNMKISDV